MAELAQWFAAFERLSVEERRRGSELIDAYNGAVMELRAANAGIGHDPLRLFSPQEVESLVLDYREHKLANIRPAMRRYLQLLEHGYQVPGLT